MDTIQKETINGRNPIITRLEAISLEMREFGIDAPPSELFTRSPQEYFLLKEFRAMRLETMKKEAQGYLRAEKVYIDKDGIYSRLKKTKESEAVDAAPSYSQ